jgi:hypothetical protein
MQKSPQGRNLHINSAKSLLAVSENTEVQSLLQLIEQTLNDASPIGFDTKSDVLRRSLRREAYFLEKEKLWLDEERQRITQLQAKIGLKSDFED